MDPINWPVPRRSHSAPRATTRQSNGAKRNFWIRFVAVHVVGDRGLVIRRMPDRMNSGVYREEDWWLGECWNLEKMAY